MRRDGDGPAYVQGGSKGAKGTNQKCSYLKGDLIAYQQANRVTDSMAAAVRKGQAFIPFVDPTPKRSVYDLTTRIPLYLDLGGRVVGCVDDTPLEIVIERLGTWNIEWMNPINAASRQWSSLSEHKEFADAVKDVLSLAIQSIDAVFEGSPSRGEGEGKQLPSL